MRRTAPHPNEGIASHSDNAHRGIHGERNPSVLRRNRFDKHGAGFAPAGGWRKLENVGARSRSFDEDCPILHKEDLSEVSNSTHC
jgi:hypothetical protein